MTEPMKLKISPVFQLFHYRQGRGVMSTGDDDANGPASHLHLLADSEALATVCRLIFKRIPKAISKTTKEEPP